MSMYEVLKTGGRKSNATLLTMIIITVVFLMQYPQIITLMLFDYNEVCFDMAYIEMFPRIEPIEYLTAMVSLIGLFGVSNAAAYYGGEKKEN